MATPTQTVPPNDDVASTEKRTMSTPSSLRSPSSFTEDDIYTYHEKNAGRLVIDPAEAEIEFGPKIASKLKRSADGTIILWPQPTDDPEDPQNWSDRRKALQLLIITLAAIVPDFDVGIGIAAIFALAGQYDTTTGVINDLSANWAVFTIGWGGIFAVMLMRRLGRLPVLFWSQLLALGFLIGCVFAPNLKTFAGMRILTAFFGTVPQVTGLYVVTDMYPFHLQARKLNLWTMGFIISPFLSPFAFGFFVARANWRWSYGVGAIYSAIVVGLIFFLGEETIFDRGVRPIPKRPAATIRFRFETVIGITGVKMQQYRESWYDACMSPFRVFWRPHLLMIMIFEGVLFGFGIGINLTNAVFLGMPKPFGYGFTPYAIAGSYGTPIVAVFIGEFIGRYANDAIANAGIRRNKGVFEAEVRLWMSYIVLPLYICGFVVLGAAFQKKLTVGALVMGWGIGQVAIMMNTVAIYAYANDCFPRHQGEISALLNLFRTLGGFAVSYFQLPWAAKNGALQTFGVEAAIVAGLFVLVVPYVQWKGRELRAKYSL